MSIAKHSRVKRSITEGSKSPPVSQLIRDEVHTPNVVAHGRRSPLFPMHRGRVPPRTLASQRQTFLGVHAVKAFLADRPAFTLQQNTEPAIPEPHTRLRQLAHALAQRGQRILSAPVVRRRPRRLDDAARAPCADVVAPDQVPHDFTLLGRALELFLNNVLQHDLVE